MSKTKIAPAKAQTPPKSPKAKSAPKSEASEAWLSRLASIGDAAAVVLDGYAGVVTCKCGGHHTADYADPACGPVVTSYVVDSKGEAHPSDGAGGNAHSNGKARRAAQADAVRLFGTCALNIARDGTVTGKAQGFLPADLLLALRRAAKTGESNTATIERLLRAALYPDVTPPTPEALAVAYAAVADAPVSPSARAASAARAARPAVTREVLS